MVREEFSDKMTLSRDLNQVREFPRQVSGERTFSAGRTLRQRVLGVFEDPGEGQYG